MVRSLLSTTENTRDLGEYITRTGKQTRCESILRSGVPESVEAVPISYMSIAKAKEMPNIFKCIANAKTGVMFNCTAGKDRTGVVAAILLLHAGVCDEDIVENEDWTSFTIYMSKEEYSFFVKRATELVVEAIEKYKDEHKLIILEPIFMKELI